MSRKVTVLGVSITDDTPDNALAHMDAMMARPEPSVLFFVNAHTLNLASAIPAYRDVLNSADAVFGDGTGVRWAALCRGYRLKGNLNGTDLVPTYLRRQDGLRCFLLGSTIERVSWAARHVADDYPTCRVVGHHHGYLNETNEEAAIEAINASHADLLLVAMGNPLQERWIARNRHRVSVKLCVGVGGLFEYWAGQLDRAPDWMRRHGVEWLHIMRRQPWKARRYLVGNPAFIARMLMTLPADFASRNAHRGEQT